MLSPGPCTPNEAGICLDLVREASASTPILGVCLGHQAIGQVFGGQVVRAPAPMHGKVSRISHKRGASFAVSTALSGDALPLADRRAQDAPPDARSHAESDDGLIMAVAHRDLPVHGVQFHPESIPSEHGHTMLGNFLTLAKDFNEAKTY